MFSENWSPLFDEDKDYELWSDYANHVYFGNDFQYTLEASLWCILNTATYSSAVLTAVNLGDDTDTTAAVTGALAGLIYGYEDIPKEWIDKLANKELIDSCLF